MSDSGPPAGRDATDADGIDTGSDGNATGGRGSPADGDSRATPRLVNAPDDDGADRSADGPGADWEPEPIEPEGLRAENALFVLLGAAGTVALLATAIVPGVL